MLNIGNSFFEKTGNIDLSSLLIKIENFIPLEKEDVQCVILISDSIQFFTGSLYL